MIKEQEALVTENLRLVHACCKRFAGKGIEYDELYSAGCVGLVYAAGRFDKSMGFAFSTYAVPVIFGEIKRLFRDGGAVKVSRSLKELSLKAIRKYDELSLKLGREPRISEIAAALEIDEAEAAEALSAAAVPLSLSYCDENGGGEMEIPVSSCTENTDDCISLSSAMENLGDSDKKLISMRYFAGKTQSETAKALGMTQVQVSRREKKILTALRKILSS